MFRESWSAVVRPDPWLGFCWWGMHGLAAVAVGLYGVAMQWPSLGSLALALVSGLLLFRLARRLPSAWFDTGHLALGGQGGRWQAGSGHLLEGKVTWLWTGPHLVGLIIEHQKGRAPIWITRRRVGNAAWWQLQRWMRFEQVRSG